MTDSLSYAAEASKYSNKCGFFFSCVFLQDNREMDRNEGLKFARKHSMLFIGKLVYMYSLSGETVGRTRYSVFR